MSTTEQHSKEPWRHVFVDGGWDGVAEPGGAVICKLVLNEPANARRIVAAVNACAGIPTEALEGGVVGELLEALRGVFVIGDRLVDDVYGHEFVQRARAAIAKGEGRDHA